MTDGPGRRRNGLLACLVMLRRMAPQIHYSEILAFLYVAENEGVRVKELAELMCATPATASRAARALMSDGDPAALSPSLGWLVMASDEREKRSRHLYLTPLGAEICEKLDVVIGRAQLIGTAATPAFRTLRG